MAATNGKLGTNRSQLGRMVLGSAAAGVIAESISNTLVFVSTAFGSTIQSGSSVLGIGQVVVGVKDAPVSVDSVLGLGSDVEGPVERPIAIANILVLADEALGDVLHNATDVLALTQAVVYPVERVVNVVQPLGLVSSLVYRGPVYCRLEHRISFEDTTGGHDAVRNLSVVTILGSAGDPTSYYATFKGTVGLVKDVSANNVLALVGASDRSFHYTNDLELVQEVQYARGRSLTSVVVLEDTVGLEWRLGRSFTSPLGFMQAVAYFVDSPHLTHQYQPLIGSSDDTAYTLPSGVVPILGSASFTLTYPYVSPTLTVVLRSPVFGDKDRLTPTRINRETFGGMLVVFADPAWPKVQTLQVQIDGLSATQAADLLEFFASSVGEEIGLLDHENRQWRGLVTTPDPTVSHVARDERSVSFEFEGELA